MNSVFDTLAYSKKLQAAGVPEKIAEAQAEALSEVIVERLATKDDVKDLKRDISDVRREVSDVRSELKKDIADVRKEMIAQEDRLSHKIEAVTYQLTIRLGSLLTAGIVLIGMLHKLFN